MIKIAIILFRECLEIALLLGIILAVTKKISNSRFYIVLGLMLGLIASSLFAFSVKYITVTYFGLGGELFDITIIFLTIILIGWTVVWIHGGYKANIQRRVGVIETNPNGLEKLLLVLVVAMTILREGAEIMLLLYSISTVDKVSVNEYLVGIGVGVFSGFLVGILIYKGLIRFASPYIFKVSATLLILIAAGLASKAAAIITSSALIEGFSDQLWDSSWLINDNSSMGRFMYALISYTAKPNILQGLLYIATVVIIVTLMKWQSFKAQRLKSQ